MPIHTNRNRRLAPAAALACAMSIAMLAMPAWAVIAPVQWDAEINNSPNAPASGPLVGVVSDPTKLVVSRSSGNGQNFVSSVLLAFPLSVLPAGTTGADLEKATMFLWVRDVRAPVGNNNNVIDFAAVASPWTEAGASFKTQPAVGAAFGSLNVSGLAAGEYFAVDLTPQVRAWLGAPGSKFGMPSEQVPRQVFVITGGSSQLYFPTAKRTGNVGYVSGSSLSYSDSNGIVTLDDAAVVNTEVTLSFWRYDMGTPPMSEFQPLSMRDANGACMTMQPADPRTKLASALQLVRSEPVTFLNALWPVHRGTPCTTKFQETLRTRRGLAP